MSVPTKHRLVTRSDFDGLVCAVLFKELEMIDDILFVHPKDMQDGKIDIQPGDITTNLPYVEGCYLAFDHHESLVKESSGINDQCLSGDTIGSAQAHHLLGNVVFVRSAFEQRAFLGLFLKGRIEVRRGSRPF